MLVCDVACVTPLQKAALQLERLATTASASRCATLVWSAKQKAEAKAERVCVSYAKIKIRFGIEGVPKYD